MQLQIAISPKPGRDNCEDVVGHANGVYWLLDGATPPSIENGAALTQKFLSIASYHLFRLACLGIAGSPSELAKLAIQAMRDDPESEPISGYSPYATAVMIMLRTDRIDYLVLGDSYLFLSIDEDGIVICDDRLKRIAVQEREVVRRMKRMGTREDSIEYTTARNALIDKERQSLNTADGYWAFGSDDKAIDHAITGSRTLRHNSILTAMAASDGFIRLTTHFGRPKKISELPPLICAEGATTLLRRLRELESDESNFIADASSKHDDASFLLLQTAI